MKKTLNRYVLVDGWWGIHVPERFIHCYEMDRWHVEDLAKELRESLDKTEKNCLDTDEYQNQCWIWDDILNSAYWEDEDGTRWHLEQDDDLFAVKDGEEDDEW